MCDSIAFNANEKFDETSCRNLKEIIDITGCKLVLTSSWRLYPSYIELMLKQLKAYGITAGDFFRKTGIKDSRAKEIYSCLQRHPEITNYVILDDEQIVSTYIPKEKIIRTQVDSGITDEIKNQCIEKLK